MMSRKVKLVAATAVTLCVGAFAAIVWPTLYIYRNDGVRPYSLVRINRFTQQTSRLTQDGWEPQVKPQVKPLIELAASELRGVEIEACDLRKRGLGEWDLWVRLRNRTRHTVQ